MTSAILPYVLHLGFSFGIMLVVGLLLFLMRNCIKTLLTVLVVILLLIFAATVILVPPCITLTPLSDNTTSFGFGVYVVNPEDKWMTMAIKTLNDCTIHNFYKNFTFLSKL